MRDRGEFITLLLTGTFLLGSDFILLILNALSRKWGLAAVNMTGVLVLAYPIYTLIKMFVEGEV